MSSQRYPLSAFTLDDKQQAAAAKLAELRGTLVHINTILSGRVLQDLAWADRLTSDDRRALTPLFWSNINPYGTFRLDMQRRLDLNRGAAGTSVPARMRA